MDVFTAKTAGFCFGVERAVKKVFDEVKSNPNEKIYTFGPIIHNQEVIKNMEKQGVKILRSEEELQNLQAGTVIIRSHGVPRRIYDLLEEKRIPYVDATCPFVKKIHKIVNQESKDGRHIIVIGNPKHPEVEGIVGWSNSDISVVQSETEMKELVKSIKKKICIVAQTTFNYNKFRNIVEIVSKKRYDVIVLNTICNATRERQTEAYEIANDVEAMIVIGDVHSSNTQKLFEICRNACKNTHFIETVKDLEIEKLAGVKKVGITAGASTPKNLIEEVQISVRIKL